ncbi:MAG: bifunctional rhamnulose-1-phosphate aldolase/short-chain dehydrogenase [Pseudomonadota bacterium]
MDATAFPPLADRWDDDVAAKLDAPGVLLYRSNLLGADLAVTNFGGGNTSAKLPGRDPLSGEDVTVLWVKGSGGDLGSMALDGFATLYMDRLEALKGLYRGPDHEDEMVALYDHCRFGLNPRAPSIDTSLHAFVPAPHVDHVHPDALIGIAASADAERLTAEVFGGELGYLPWRRPGFELGMQLGAMATGNPGLQGVVLGGHGVFTWGDTARECYATTMRILRQAAEWIGARTPAQPFGGQKVEALAFKARAKTVARLMPMIRGQISDGSPKVGHFTDAPEVLEFVNSNALGDLAPLGTSCPDHFLRTKIRPLVLESGIETEPDALGESITAYQADYAAYYDRCKRPDSPAMRDPNAVVYLVPGLGMMTFAANKATARISAEFYVNAINVMRGASSVSTYCGLPEQEAFDIEYWLLEEAKLQRLPKPKPLAGRVALVTGAAGGIGGATCARLAAEGAAIVATDIDAERLGATVASLQQRFGRDNAVGVAMDVTSEAAVQAAFAEAVRSYGGIDILVSNAGIASAAKVEDTTLALWNRNMDILATGYFLAAREAFRLMLAQGTGGSIVFIGSKNALAASGGASAYCTAKAAEVHLARCLALEGAPKGIRVNTVNPDAVLEGSTIWQGQWRAQRAASYGVEEDDLARVYRERSLLKRSVLPEDIAEAVAFLASDRAAKSTGNILNVDAGNATAFTR